MRRTNHYEIGDKVLIKLAGKEHEPFEACVDIYRAQELLQVIDKNGNKHVVLNEEIYPIEDTNNNKNTK